MYEGTPEGINVNTYNLVIMKAWQANMDLQFVSNPYACIHYIVSYVTKDEQEMGEALRKVCKTCSNIRHELDLIFVKSVRLE